MIRGGDELGHTQDGNNNAYCQDNELSWLHWDQRADQHFLKFCQDMAALWHAQPVLKRRNFFQGRRIRGAGVKDIAWLTPAGIEIADHEWHSGAVRALGMRLNGESIDEMDERGQPISGDTLLILLNSYPEQVEFRLPKHKPSERWVSQFDTSQKKTEPTAFSQDQSYPLQGRSVVVLILKTNWSPLKQLLHRSHPSPPAEVHNRKK